MINLTRQEKMVIQLLVACFLVGATIRIYKMRSNRINNEKSRQQTVVTDSFQLYASQIDSEYTELQRSGHSTYQSQKSTALQQKINLNTATKQELMLLPKIGSVTADHILEYRAQVGKFNRIEELLNVKGIGTKTFEKIKGEVTLE
ncbi:MAG TPA: helix-hairpin-helix domain-containing protein [Candidatus Marinimicrobia bacterium]|nr:helix-hairpin-helix domain-containing protein [Candidatus Neomarinimicrobiota bacterium]HQE94579.1 helix-hairpin-helix domain-containing protein [Candidatus Neomarinimicrobiota bacterium]HQH55208.1 helix-hairpin-helix domain-containing protein [Candidatus Neomarinimicrobiota bacterium]HQK10890.1 helix-hairpin-helix domain-containing protein [Candidatus Neomarinimicrobiota bacterium]